MSGVEILTSQEVAIEYAFNWVAFWIAFGIAMIITIIASTLFAYYLSDEVSVGFSFSMLICVGLFCSVFTGCLLGRIGQVPIKYETQYKVTISNEVKISDFYEKYEIIEQDGKIFTVREKQNEGE